MSERLIYKVPAVNREEGDLLASFVAGAVAEFGASYAYPGIAQDATISFVGNRRGQFEKQLILRRSNSIDEPLVLDRVDLDWFLMLMKAGLTPGVNLRGASDDTTVLAFTIYLLSRNLGVVEQKPGGPFFRDKALVRLNSHGRQRLWDLLRLYWWPASNQPVTVLVDAEGAVVYEWPPVDNSQSK